MEDLFHYMQHKEQFNKPLKRKDFREAIEEIELDILNGNSGVEEQENTTVQLLMNLFVFSVSTECLCFRVTNEETSVP